MPGRAFRIRLTELDASAISGKVDVREKVPVRIGGDARMISWASRGDTKWVASSATIRSVHRIAHARALPTIRWAVTAGLKKVANTIATDDWTRAAVL